MPAPPKGGARRARKRSRRSRTDSLDIVDQYEGLYHRVLSHSTAETINASFSDKELRILMGQNKLLINNFDPATGKYTEKTKLQKSETLLTILHELVEPEDLRIALPKPQRQSSRTPRRPQSMDFKSDTDSDSDSTDGQVGRSRGARSRAGSRARGGSAAKGASRSKSARKPAAANTAAAEQPPGQMGPLGPLGPPLVDQPNAWPQPAAPLGPTNRSSSYDPAWEPGLPLSDPTCKPPAAASQAVAQASMAAAAHAEAAARGGDWGPKLVEEESTPDMSPSPDLEQQRMQMQMQTHMQMQMAAATGQGAALSVSGGPHRLPGPLLPPGQMPLAAWQELSRAGAAGPPPAAAAAAARHEPAALAQVKQEGPGAAAAAAAPRMGGLKMELLNPVPAEEPWHVSDSLTSPIPPLIYADDCQLNGGLNEVGEDGRVALEEKTNSPTSATSVDAAFERSERSPTGGLEAQSW